MVEKKGVVKTDVDSLVNLVKKRGEISFEEASVELSVSVSTIESWANFLEEEGELSINYKFTTPYLVSVEKNINLNEEVLTKSNLHLGELENLFTLNTENISKEDFNSAHDTTLKLHDKIKEIVTVANKDKALTNIINPSLISERLNVFKNVIKHTNSLKKKGDFTRLKAAYDQINSDFEDLYKSMKKSINQAIELNKNKLNNNEENDESETIDETVNIDESEKDEIKSEEQIKFKEDINLENEVKPNINFNINSIEDYNNLLKIVDEALQKNDYETVKEIYSQIESFYKNMPEKFVENRNNIKNSLFELNKKLSNKLGDESLKKIDEKSSEIHELVKKIRKNIEEKNIEEAEKNYENMEKIFSELPEGYLDTKINLENLIVDVHSELINTEKEIYIKEINEAQIKINNLIIKINDSLNKLNISNAYSLYTELNNIFKTIPEGFFQEKLNLQKKLSRVYENILLVEKEVNEVDFKEKVEKIYIVFKEAEEFYNLDDLEGASFKLNEMNKIFDTLPKGFIEFKSKIENQILNFSKKIFNLEQKHMSNKFENLKKQIEKLFLVTNSYYSSKNYDLAKESYKEILFLYNKMPEGFLKEKSEIKSKILELYQSLMLDDGIKSEKVIFTSIEEKYNNLLKLIVKIHEDIHTEQFELMKEKYRKVVSLYNDLPIGFIQNRLNVRHEILKIYDLIKLYTLTKEVEIKFKKGNFYDVKKDFKIISQLYNELFEECKEDIELFLYVKEKYTQLYDQMSQDNKISKDEIKEVISSEDFIKNFENLRVNNYEEKTIKKEKSDQMIQSKDEGSQLSYKTEIDEKKIFNLVMNSFFNKDFDTSLLHMRTLLENDSSNEKYYYFYEIILKIKNNQFFPDNEKEAFFSLLYFLYFDENVDSKLALVKLIRAVYNFFENNIDLVEDDFNKMINLFPNNKNILKLNKYVLKK